MNKLLIAGTILVGAATSAMPAFAGWGNSWRGGSYCGCNSRNSKCCVQTSVKNVNEAKVRNNATATSMTGGNAASAVIQPWFIGGGSDPDATNQTSEAISQNDLENNVNSLVHELRFNIDNVKVKNVNIADVSNTATAVATSGQNSASAVGTPANPTFAKNITGPATAVNTIRNYVNTLESDVHPD